MAHASCGGHKPYRSRREAEYAASWHLTCAKCKEGRPFHPWQCLPDRQHYHIGHARLPNEIRAARVAS